MNKKQTYLIIITLLLFITAVWYETHVKYVVDLKGYITEIETFLHTQERDVEDFFKDSKFVQFQVFKEKSDCWIRL